MATRNSTTCAPGSSMHYQYKPLNSPRAFRLLMATVGKDVVDYSLVEADIDSPPPYVAISYVWGDPTIVGHISIDGREHGFTASLSMALLDAYRSIAFCKDSQLDFCAEINSRHTYIWADAICINQHDVDEKSSQVSLMTDIYANAAFVITHMGAADESTIGGFKLLMRLTAWFNERQASGEDLNLPPGYDLKGLGLPPATDPDWSALRALVCRDWTNRAWIVQEFVVNENIVLVCGHISFPAWRVLSEMVFLSAQNKLPAECLHERHAEDESLSNGPDRIYALSQLRTYYRQGTQLNKSLLQLLRTGHPLLATDPRDKVFAFLNLARDRDELGIRLDYSGEYTTEKVYVSTAIRLIQDTGSLDVFSSVMVNKTLDGLPSWAPDWSTRPLGLGRDLLFHTEAIKANIYQASGDTTASSHYDESTSELRLKGAIIDRVAVVMSDIVSALGLIDQSFPQVESKITMAQLQAIFQALTTVGGHSRYGDGEDFKNAFGQTLTANTTHDGYEAGRQALRCYDAYVERSSNRLRSIDTPTLAANFERAMLRVLMGRSLAATDSGYICLVQDGVQPSDVVAVLRGGRTAYILRPGQAGRYTLLCDAYVHGLMKGEALLWTNLSEDICLI